MKIPLHKEQPAQIQLELPDYSYAYEEWLRNQESKKEQDNSSLIIIDIY
jgi:hypothetical protein